MLGKCLKGHLSSESFTDVLGITVTMVKMLWFGHLKGLFGCFEARAMSLGQTQYVGQADLELTELSLPLLPKC